MNTRQQLLVKATTVILMSFFMATNVWADDAEDDKDAAQDTTSKTEDTAADEPDKFDPPHDQHANSTPENESHKAGAGEAGGADLAEAATDPSAILAQLGFFAWNTSSSDNHNSSVTGLFQPVLPLTRTNVLRPALPIISTAGSDGKFGIGDLFLLDYNFVQCHKCT